MLIVAGWIDVAANERDAYLAARLDSMVATRSEPGCHEYVFSADPIDPSRVRLFELWESRSDLDVHLEVLRSRATTAPGVAVLHRSVAVYETSGAEPLG
jgi:quinol monooxygenase YgiN